MKRKLLAMMIVLGMISVGLSVLVNGEFSNAGLPDKEDTLLDVESNIVNAHSSSMIRLQRASFDTNLGEPDMPASLSVDTYADSWYTPYIIQRDSSITEEWKDSLRQSGMEIVSYIPDNAVLVWVPKSNVNQIPNLPDTQWSGIYQPAYKINPALDHATGTVPLSINFFLTGTNGPTVRFLQNYDVEFVNIARSDKVNNLVVKADASLINEIANFADVNWITEYHQPTVSLNPSSQLLQSGSTSGGRVIADDPTDPIPGRQINGDLKNDGAGFGDGDRKVVCVSDTGIRTTHEVWSEPGKIIDNYVPEGSAGQLGVEPGNTWEHGQATASMVCGDAPASLDYTISGDGKDGGAFSARLIFQDIGLNVPDDFVYPPADYYHDLFEDAQYGDIINGHIGGASLHSNSWGGGGFPESGYGYDSAQIDDYVWDNKDFLICFSAGNGGADYIGSPQEIDDQAESKNCIGVGATNEGGTAVATMSSWGPTVPDGRIKPDLVAVGQGITTASNSDDTGYWPDSFEGTSASSPGLAGHAALVQQYFEDGWSTTGTQVNDNGFTPSAALVKAALINGAVDIGTADIPNMQEGWGRIQLENSLYFSGDSKINRYIDYGYKQPGTTEGTGLCAGENIEYTFGVNDGTQPFKVSLVYSDYKANPSAAVMLVNDLDLMVTGPSGTFYGNNFLGGFSQPGIYDDNLNNIECVYINSPAAGTYTISIDAENVPIGPQDFALVVSGSLDEGYGIITMDSMTYTAPDTINIRVEDNNNLAGSVNITLTSSGSGDSETVTLSALPVAGTGIFTSSINTAFDTVTPEDGVLQVNNNDTVTATYPDSDPVHNSIATAVIQSLGPIAINVRVEDIIGTVATVKWDTNIPSNSRVYYGTGTDSGLWVDEESNNAYSTIHSVILTGLSVGTQYYFDVESSTTRGVTSRDDNGNAHFTFSTLGLQQILLVDDDGGTRSPLDGTPFNEDWENNLNALDWTYSRWDIATMGIPTQADLEQCEMVAWVAGEAYPQISAVERAVLGDYLSSSPNPKLYVVGQDIGWDMNINGTDPDVAWYEKHFHSIFNGDDADGGNGDEGTAFQVIGLANDTISGDYTGGIDLDQSVFGAGRFWPEDITNNGGTITWDYNRHIRGGNAAGVRADEAQSMTHTGYPAGYRLVYEAWTHEMMGTWNPPVVDPIRSDIMDKSCAWLLGPIAHWPFSEGWGGWTNDTSGNDNLGQLMPGYPSNVPTWTSGISGNALDFDGIDDSVEIPDDDIWDLGGASNGNDFTISHWINIETYKNAVLIHQQDASNWWYVEVRSIDNTLLLADRWNDIGWWTWTPSTGVWYNIVITKTGNDYDAFINGVSLGIQASSVNIPNVASPLRIGASNGNYFDGIIDEVSIWSRALSLEEIWDNYNETLSGPVHNIDTDEYFTEIQAAIDDVDTLDGHTIEVAAGIYNENVVVDKSLTLVGEDRDTTIIDGGGVGDVVLVTADWVNVSGFTVKNSGIFAGYAGIYLLNSENCCIENNHVTNNQQGIFLESSSNNNITSNNVSANDNFGIYAVSSNNNLVSNNAINNWGGISLSSSSNNEIYHNNFIANTIPAQDDSTNFWDNDHPSGGNYWSDWTSPDTMAGPNQDIPGSDGFVDNPRLIDGGPNQDNYPFTTPNGWDIILPNMIIEKWAPATAFNGETITYWINYSNIGTDWADNVVITETYPAGVTFIGSIPAPDIGNNVWLIGSVAPGASNSIEITVQINPSVVGIITNTVNLSYDNSASIAQPTESALADTMIAFQLQLNQGWNLFSLPLIPPDSSLDGILGDALTGGTDQGQSDKVFKWDPINEKWLVAYLYEDGIPANTGWLFVTDIFTMEPDFAYWVWIREDLNHSAVTINMFGAIPGERNVNMSVGWNLVGYTSVNTVTLQNGAIDSSGLYASGFTGGLSQAESDRIYSWDGIGWQVQYIWENGTSPLDGTWVGTTFDLAPGKGYWIEIRETHADFIWTYG